MPKFVLIAEHCDENGEPESTVTHQFNYEYLNDVVMALNDFLHGVGYVFDGELCINEPVQYSATDLGKEVCSGCACDELFGDPVEHNEYFYDTGRNR